MSQPLNVRPEVNVRPEDLISVSGMLSECQSVATGSVMSASGTAVPLPADVDPVGGAEISAQGAAFV